MVRPPASALLTGGPEHDPSYHFVVKLAPALPSTYFKNPSKLERCRIRVLCRDISLPTTVCFFDHDINLLRMVKRPSLKHFSFMANQARRVFFSATYQLCLQCMHIFAKNNTLREDDALLNILSKMQNLQSCGGAKRVFVQSGPQRQDHCFDTRKNPLCYVRCDRWPPWQRRRYGWDRDIQRVCKKYQNLIASYRHAWWWGTSTFNCTKMDHGANQSSVSSQHALLKHYRIRQSQVRAAHPCSGLICRPVTMYQETKTPVICHEVYCTLYTIHRFFCRFSSNICIFLNRGAWNSPEPRTHPQGWLKVLPGTACRIGCKSQKRVNNETFKRNNLCSFGRKLFMLSFKWSKCLFHFVRGTTSWRGSWGASKPTPVTWFDPCFHHMNFWICHVILSN